MLLRVGAIEGAIEVQLMAGVLLSPTCAWKGRVR